MLNPFAKLFEKSDLEKSADLAGELERHERTWPAIEKEYFERDKKCCEISFRLTAAKNCGSPTMVSLHEELTAAMSARDRGPNWFNLERSRLRNQLERLTAPAIREFHRQCVEWTKQAHAERRVNVLERTFDPRTEKQLARISSNLDVVRDAKRYINEMRSEVSSLQHRPLAEIHAKIDEVTARVQTFNFDKLESDDEWRSASLIQDFMAEGEPVNAVYDRGWLVSAPGQSSGGWKVVRTDSNP